MQCSVSVCKSKELEWERRGDGREKHVRCDKSQECRWCFWALYYFFYLDGWQNAGPLLGASPKMRCVGILNNKQQQ